MHVGCWDCYSDCCWSTIDDCLLRIDWLVSGFIFSVADCFESTHKANVQVESLLLEGLTPPG
jgi:hypothetical protein